MLVEAEVRQWVRDEREKIRREEQSSCRHFRNGTLHLDGVVTCDKCDKVMTHEDAYE